MSTKITQSLLARAIERKDVTVEYILHVLRRAPAPKVVGAKWLRTKRCGNETSWMGVSTILYRGA